MSVNLGVDKETRLVRKSGGHGLGLVRARSRAEQLRKK